jgi:hypothetical protein
MGPRTRPHRSTRPSLAPSVATSLSLAAALLLAVACSPGGDGAGTDAGGGGTTTTTTSTPPVTAAPYASEQYADPTNWLCLPGRVGDACDIDLSVTLVAADGTRTVEPAERVTDAPVDCFYVYPTISGDDPPNADLQAGDEERGVVDAQFARFGQICRTFAPIYRQVPLRALSALPGATTTTTTPGTPAPRELAYGDVLDAWKHYLANDNPLPDGSVRPFVLIGHSQGAGHLRRLISEEIDGDEELRSKLVSALLIGSGVPAPGAEGAFVNVPPCTSPEDLGCVVSYASFAADGPPPENSLFGAVREGEGRVVCTNPAALGGGVAPLDTIAGAPPGQGFTTPAVRYDGLVTGECVQEGRFDWLRVTNAWAPGDARTEDLGGRITPQWGLHLIDVNLAQGNLIGLVRTQAGRATG